MKTLLLRRKSSELERQAEELIRIRRKLICRFQPPSPGSPQFRSRLHHRPHRPPSAVPLSVPRLKIDFSNSAIIIMKKSPRKGNERRQLQGSQVVSSVFGVSGPQRRLFLPCRKIVEARWIRNVLLNHLHPEGL